MTQRILEDLGPDECASLLHRASVGRLVYVDDDGPVAIPVNYAVAEGDVVIRVESGTKRAALEQERVAFEVDHVDEETHDAWSVLVRGAAIAVDMDSVPDLLRRMDDAVPQPWAAGVHNVWIKIVPAKISGRRLGGPATGVVY